MAGSGTSHLRDESETLLRAEHLTVEFPVGRSGLRVHAVSDISIDLIEGETLGLVGESGCGKSTTGRALMQFPPPNAGRVQFDDIDLTSLEGEDLRQTRTRMQMIFQDPISSLNPRRTVGQIVSEPLAIWAQPESEERAATTTAAGYIVLALGAVLALVSALTLVAGTLAGLGIVDGRVDFGAFTVDSSIGSAVGAFIWTAVTGAAATGVATAGRAALDRASGARTGVMATLGVLAGVLLLGVFILGLTLLAALAVVAVGVVVGLLVFSPSSKPDFPAVGDAAMAKVDATLTSVGLDPEVAKDKRPHEFSGGQCQRISIARALVLDPKLIICDEPVSALDVSVQAQILNLLEDMKARYGLTLVFIAHDLAVVKNVSDRVVVMYLGKLCEVAPPDTLYHEPAHPYTSALIEAIPIPDPAIAVDQKPALTGELPSPVAPPSGCRFRTRCPRAEERCAEEEPIMREVSEGHYVACHFPLVATTSEA